MKLSEKLFTLRRQHGLSQDDLAIKLDISRQAVYKWENDQSKPELDKLKMLSDLFNVSIDNLLDDNSDIVFKPTNAKKSYSAVTVLDVPKSNISETTHLSYTDSEKKEINKANLTKKISFITIIVSIISLIGCVMTLFSSSTPEWVQSIWIFWLIISIGLLIGSIKIFSFFKDFTNDEVVDSSSNFTNIKNSAKYYFDSNSYDSKILLSDCPVWFFFNAVTNDKFGFYFDDKEQFICPIQNYVNFVVDAPFSKTNNIAKYRLQYFNESGELCTYYFELLLTSKHTTDKSGFDSNRIFRFDECKKAGDWIKEYLDNKKNSLK